MNVPNKLLSKVSALIFFGLFLISGYNCISRYSYYNKIGYLQAYLYYSSYIWIHLLLLAATAICYLIVAIGCFTGKRGFQIVGFGLMAVLILGSLLNASSLSAITGSHSNSASSQFHTNCVSLARIAYALILLMAIRIPSKARILGIVAAGVYSVAYIYYLLAGHESPSVSGVLNLLLLGCGAILFGFLTNIQDQIAKNSAEAERQQSSIWICPDCGTENKISKMSCSECGRLRN